MGKAHGETQAQDARSLRGMPSRHSRRAHSRVIHGLAAGEPVAVKAAWRVREGAVREKGRKWHLARQPTSTQETGGRAQAYGAARREDPRDMAKAGLPESQSPEGVRSPPPERRL